MNSQVSGELVRPRESFQASWVRTCVRFFSGVGSNMPSLMFKSVERLVTNGTLVGSLILRFLLGHY